MKYNVGSLFAGVGGVCLGFKRSHDSVNLIFANEMDDKACETYRYNFKHNLIDGDIEKILNPNIIHKEREFLISRKKELDLIDFSAEPYDIKIVKDSIKKLSNSFFTSVAMSKNFELTDNLKNKIEKLKYNLDTFTKYIEFNIISNILNDLTSEKSNKLFNIYQNKNQEILKEKIDILTAGFPCQAFSIAGDRKGFNDHRGELFYSVLNLVTQLENIGHGKPRVLFLENVKILLTHDKGNTFKTITNEIEKLGYTIKFKVLNTYKYTDLPQNRERIFVVCFLNESDSQAFGSFDDFKEKNHTRNDLKKLLKNKLDYHLNFKTNPEFYYTRNKYPAYFITPKEFEDSHKKSLINLTNDMTDMFEVYQVRRGQYIRKNKSGVCPTLTANMGTGGHNVPLIKTFDGIRKLSPTDCFNLQGFNIGETYKLPSISNASLYKQAGNSVSVDLIEMIAKKIISALNTNNIEAFEYNKLEQLNKEISFFLEKNSIENTSLESINQFKQKIKTYL